MGYKNWFFDETPMYSNPSEPLWSNSNNQIYCFLSNWGTGSIAGRLYIKYIVVAEGFQVEHGHGSRGIEESI